jgi:hypothetical protein
VRQAPSCPRTGARDGCGLLCSPLTRWLPRWLPRLPGVAGGETRKWNSNIRGCFRCRLARWADQFPSSHFCGTKSATSQDILTSKHAISFHETEEGTLDIESRRKSANELNSWDLPGAGRADEEGGDFVHLRREYESIGTAEPMSDLAQGCSSSGVGHRSDIEAGKS